MTSAMIRSCPSYVLETSPAKRVNSIEFMAHFPFCSGICVPSGRCRESDAFWPTAERTFTGFALTMDGMKHSNNIKNLLNIRALALATGWAQSLCAFTYSDSDRLLVFREDTFKDVEFNLGSISNFLGKANGTVITVTNWDFQLVRSNFNNQFATDKFVLAATTSSSDSLRRNWLTDGSASGTPTDISGSKMSGIYSKISFVGNQAQTFTPTNSSEVYIIDPSDVSS